MIMVDRHYPTDVILQARYSGSTKDQHRGVDSTFIPCAFNALRLVGVTLIYNFTSQGTQDTTRKVTIPKM